MAKIIEDFEKYVKNSFNHKDLNSSDIVNNILIHQVVKKRNFPSSGVKFRTRIVNPDNLRSQFLEKFHEGFFKDLFAHIHGDITVQRKKDYILEIVFKSYEAIALFAQALFKFDYSVVNKESKK